MKQELLDKMHVALKAGKLTKEQVVFYIFELMADLLENHEIAIDDIHKRLDKMLNLLECHQNIFENVVDTIINNILERLAKLEGK
jgi:polyhydroxyalkanoate synthesis regulator phasin